MESLVLIDRHGKEVDVLLSGEPITIRGVFRANRVIPEPEIIFGFHSTDFVYIASMGTAHLEDRPNFVIGRNVIDCHIERLPLVPGGFGVRVSIIDRFRREMFNGEGLQIFSVKANAVPVSRMAGLGLVDIHADWVFHRGMRVGDMSSEPLLHGSPLEDHRGQSTGD